MKKKILHFDIDSPFGFYTACGLPPDSNAVGRFNWKLVTCKNCLKHKPKRRASK